MIFVDSPARSYALWNNNIKIVVPIGETINSIGHNSRGKDKISFDEVLTKTLNSIK